MSLAASKRSDHVRETLCKLSAQCQLHAAGPVLVADLPWARVIISVVTLALCMGGEGPGS